MVENYDLLGSTLYRETHLTCTSTTTNDEVVPVLLVKVLLWGLPNRVMFN